MRHCLELLNHPSVGRVAHSAAHSVFLCFVAEIKLNRLYQLINLLPRRVLAKRAKLTRGGISQELNDVTTEYGLSTILLLISNHRLIRAL